MPENALSCVAMAELINLNKARKERAKGARKIEAAHNRAKFGLPKGQSEAAKLEADRVRRTLDDARRDPKDD